MQGLSVNFDTARSKTKGNPVLRAWLALGAVYFVWGSTFTGIQVAVKAIPPFMMAGTRYLLAGVILYLVVGRAGSWRFTLPPWREVRSSAIVGLFLLLGANGLVSWAELRVPSGLAALIIATVPLWMALIGLALWKQPSPGRIGWLGVLVGLGGVAVLAAPGSSGHLAPISTLALLSSALFWAFGSLYSRRAPMPQSVFLASALEMIFGGLGLIVVGLSTGEAGRIAWSHIVGAPLLGYIWLVFGGSILGFTCYAYALKVLPTTTVATYAYVNPVVALVLGFFILHQGLTPSSALAAALITVGVILMVSGPRLSRRRAEQMVEAGQR